MTRTQARIWAPFRPRSGAKRCAGRGSVVSLVRWDSDGKPADASSAKPADQVPRGTVVRQANVATSRWDPRESWGQRLVVNRTDAEIYL